MTKSLPLKSHLITPPILLRFFKELRLPNRLLAPLYTSFLVLVLLIIVQGGMSFLLGTYNQRLADQVVHSLMVQRQAERILSAALDEQTSLRGYLLTQDKSILEPYRFRAQTTFYESFSQLSSLVEDDPAQLQQLKPIKEIYENWQHQFAEKVVNGTASRTSLPAKILFDPMRWRLNTILQYEDSLLRRRQQQLHQLNQLRNALAIFNLSIVLAGVGWNIWLLRRRVEQPIQQLKDVGQAWRAGHLEVQLNYSSRDEIGQLASALDAMARELHDRQKRNQSRNQQLEDLISALSHDLRTPLLATRTTLRSMLNGAFGPVNETWQEVLEEYRQSNEHLIKLVNTLLDVSRYEADGSRNLICEPLDWDKILTQAAAQIRAGHPQKCDLIIQIPPKLSLTDGDPVEIQRVVQNLLENAIRVSEPEQPIVLEVTELKVGQVMVAVRDRGPGIAPQEKERLFHRFIQGRGRRGGMGLGLYLCRQIVEAHGGTINVDSIPGEGSTFWFTLPTAIKDSGQQLATYS